MNKKLKDEINNLLDPEHEVKQDILAVSKIREGVYKYQGEEINEQQLKELSSHYNRTVVWILKT